MTGSEAITETSAIERSKPKVWIEAAVGVVAALAYFALARVCLSFASLNASATPIWPPTGLAIALVLVRGRPMVLAILIGAFAANFLTTPSVLTAGAIAVGNAGEAYVAALLLRRWADGEHAFYSTAGVARFAFVVAAAAAPLSATIGVTALAVAGFAPWRGFGPIWMTWWVGDLAGAILAAPALVLWARTLSGKETRRVSLQTLFTFLGAALVGLLAFSPLSPTTSGARSAFSLLAILPLTWSALRLGLRDTATTALIVSSFAIWGAVAGSSPFTQATLNDTLLTLVAFIVAATLPSLALAADRRETQLALDQTRQELAQSLKVEALGQLTGTVAHDFNNLLASMSAGLHALNRQEEERAKTLETLSQTLQRGAGLTKQLLAFARREPLKLEVINLNAAMAHIEAMIRQSLGESVIVDTRMAPGLWPVRVDRGQLELALLNLALNARDAMGTGGRLRIEAENVVSEGRQEVCITVADTGVGMNADVMARAFDPFFTTKGPGSGTGLGLAQVYGFAKQAGGAASIESTPGQGTSVSITLPRG